MSMSEASKTQEVLPILERLLRAEDALRIRAIETERNRDRIKALEREVRGGALEDGPGGNVPLVYKNAPAAGLMDSFAGAVKEPASANGLLPLSHGPHRR